MCEKVRYRHPSDGKGEDVLELERIEDTVDLELALYG